MYTFKTLDDDLYGTRARDNQVKKLSARKADREGHTADAFADALFKVSLMVRFRRRGESQSTNVSKLLKNVIEGRGEQSLHGLIVTADRGYGGLSLIRIVLQHGVGSITVLPNHLLRCQPFAGRSYLNVGIYDDEAPSDYEISSTPETAIRIAAVPSSNVTVTSEEGVSGHQASQKFADRRRAFIIDDGRYCGPASFFATKYVTPVNSCDPASTCRKSQITAISVRERGTDKYSKWIRFMYTVPSAIREGFETWIAAPKTAPVNHLLFSKHDDNGRLAPLRFSQPRRKKT